MSEHTIGKWEVSRLKTNPNTYHYFAVIDARTGDAPATPVAGIISKPIIEDTEANARLIAAAPDLLAACKGLIEDKDLVEQDEGIAACQCTTKMPEDAIEPLPCVYCVAKATIAKATK